MFWTCHHQSFLPTFVKNLQYIQTYDIQLHLQNFMRANNNWMAGRCMSIPDLRQSTTASYQQLEAIRKVPRLKGVIRYNTMVCTNEETTYSWKVLAILINVTLECTTKHSRLNLKCKLKTIGIVRLDYQALQ